MSVHDFNKARAAKRTIPKVLTQHMRVLSLPHDASQRSMTLCTLRALVSIETVASSQASTTRVMQINARLVFINETNGAAYVVDADAGTCTCPVWRKHHTCPHTTSVREQFYF